MKQGMQESYEKVPATDWGPRLAGLMQVGRALWPWK